MSGQRYAITFQIRPGTEQNAASILSSYTRPAAEIDAHSRLLATTVLIKGDTVIRIIEVEGSMPAVMQHLGQQPEVQAVEKAINPLLVEKRDLTKPGAARNFYVRASMDPVTDPAPVVPPEDRDPSSRPYGFLYRFKAGTGARADGCFSAAGGTSIFRQDDIAVRFYECTGGAEAAVEHLARIAVEEAAGERLRSLLTTPAELSSEAGWRKFFTEQMMDVVTYRVAAPRLAAKAPSGRPASRRGSQTTQRTAAGVIDFHCHLVPERWARIGDIPYQMTDIAAFFAAKEAAGIELSVVINAMFHHPASRVDFRGLEMQREFIDFAHRLIATHQGAVTALVGVNPFGGDPALRALKEAINEAGFPGVTVNSSVDGELLDSPAAAEFWAVVAELDVPVFIHPPMFTTPQQADWDVRFVSFVVRPLDIALGVSAIVTAGILEKHPGLRIVCASGGGVLASLAERLNQAYSKRELGLGATAALGGATSAAAAQLKTRPSEYIRRLYVDTCVHGTNAFLSNLDLFGPKHMLFGTDNPPVNLPAVDQIEAVENLLTSDADRRAVLADNARAMLGLAAQPISQGPATRTATSKM